MIRSRVPAVACLLIVALLVPASAQAGHRGGGSGKIYRHGVHHYTVGGSSGGLGSSLEGSRVIDGCYIVPNPTPANYTNCSGLNDLAYIDFSGSDLSWAHLTGQILLRGAKFPGVHLNNADLSTAILEGATLTGARLDGATLNGTLLDGADLTGATLTGADLSGAHMFTAILDDVVWGHTTCPDRTNSDDNGNTCVGHLAWF